MASILWTGPENTLIRTTLDAAGDGHRLAGTVLTKRDKLPLEIRYVILTDNSWAPRDVGVHILGGESDARLALAADGRGNWTLDKKPLDDFDGCVDIDFGFTPGTNTLAINRLGLDIGESRQVQALWIGYPGEPVTVSSQSYTRLDDRRYDYVNPDFKDEILLNEDGLVESYGPWKTVAAN